MASEYWIMIILVHHATGSAPLTDT